MATFKLDTEIENKVKSAFQVNKQDINSLMKLFNSVLKPRIKSRYLSHLVGTIEDIISEKIKNEVIKTIEAQKQIASDDEKQVLINIETVITSKRYRHFAITLIPMSKTSKKASVRIVKGNALIYYLENLEEKQKRILIAHELGHIAGRYLFDKTESRNEQFANLFAFLAMLDKNNFYKNECKEFTFKSDVELLNDIISLILPAS